MYVLDETNARSTISMWSFLGTFSHMFVSDGVNHLVWTVSD